MKGEILSQTNREKREKVGFPVRSSVGDRLFHRNREMSNLPGQSRVNDFMCYGRVALASPSLKWEDLWIEIRSFWLQISKKIGQPCCYLLPLDLTSVSGAFQETGIQNSIAITTTPTTGGFKIYLRSTNRYDIIQLFHAIRAGQAVLADMLKENRIGQQCTCEVETTGVLFGLGKSKMKLEETPQGLELSGNKRSQKFEFDHIQSLHTKMGDSAAHSRLCVNVYENGSTVAKEYNCGDQDNLMAVISCFIMNSYVWSEANRTELPPAESMALPIASLT
jgi:hypothetical protein